MIVLFPMSSKLYKVPVLVAISNARVLPAAIAKGSIAD